MISLSIVVATQTYYITNYNGFLQYADKDQE